VIKENKSSGRGHQKLPFRRFSTNKPTVGAQSIVMRNPDTNSTELRVVINSSGVRRVEGDPTNREGSLALCAELMPAISRLHRDVRKRTKT
jgi:hypothetical protein